jgi:phosphotransferase system enzyme I (PtsI)
MSADERSKKTGFNDKAQPEKTEIVKYGISASPGIVICKAFLKDSALLVVPQTRLADGEIDNEIERFKSALINTKKELNSIKGHISEQMGDNHARIFESHLLIIDDVMFHEDTVDLIRSERLNAAASFQRVANRVMSSFDQI